MSIIAGKKAEGGTDPVKIGVAYVQDFAIKNPVRSYLFVDDGVLKFYNHATDEVKTVDLT